MTTTTEEKDLDLAPAFPNPQNGPLGYQPGQRVVELAVEMDNDDSDEDDDQADNDTDDKGNRR